MQIIIEWRHCKKCKRSSPMQKVAGDDMWQCPWCLSHETEKKTDVE
ncbi:MAG: hypothetical protein GY851_03395 [bacterium]|nr:hypothetical protein [bacterium]